MYPQVYDFMNYTERLPGELFTFFVKKHLEENNQKNLKLQKDTEPITLKTLNE